MSAALIDRSVRKLAWLSDTNEVRVSPEHVRDSEDRDVYAYMQEIGLLQMSAQAEAQVLCPSCSENWIRPSLKSNLQLGGLCLECGDVALAPQHTRCAQLRADEIARRLQAALGVQQRFELVELVAGHLWRLGELEVGRKRYVLFFSYGVCEMNDARVKALKQQAPIGTAVVFSFDISTSGLDVIAASHVPLAAVLRLRKTGFVLSDWHGYLNTQYSVNTNDAQAPRTSLHLLRSSHVALVSGERVSVPRDARAFLLLLLEANGEEIYKSELADRLGKPHDFKVSALFRRCKPLLDTFVIADERGRYRIDERYCATEKGESL